MRLIEPYYEIVHFPVDSLERIEIAARTCYKSEDLMCKGSAEVIARRLIRSGHLSMIEFGGVAHIKFYSNRAFTHQLVRHRLASFGQESARWCNYAKDKFGNEITNISPDTMIPYIKKASAVQVYLDSMEKCFEFCEKHYMKMIKAGVPTQLAREALNIGLKSEINIMANLREWRLIFKERCSRKASPRMRELMIPLLLDFRDRIPGVFDDILDQVEIGELKKLDIEQEEV